MATLYSNMKHLLFQDHLEALREKRVIAPVHIRIKPTNICNHKCWYCAYRSSDLKLGEDMNEKDSIPEHKMYEIVEDIIKMGVKAVTFSGGGEPLAYKPLPDVIEKLGKAGVRVASLTNGSLLKGRVADAFAEYGSWVRVSTDAWDNESFTKSRGVPDKSFDMLIENMALFASKKSKCVLGVSLIVNKDNYNHVFDICKIMKDIGVNHVKVSGAIIGNTPLENNKYHEIIKKEVASQIKQSQDLLADNSFSILNHYHDIEERFVKNYNFCPFLIYLTVIAADQKVYTCQDKAYTKEGLLGSIENKSFAEFWFSEENRQKLYSINPEKICGHHCVAHSKNLSLIDFLNIDYEHSFFV